MVDWGREFAGEEGVEGTEAGVKFGGGEAAVAIERAEKVGGGTLAFFGIALEAAGNQVAVGIAAGLDARLDVVEALGGRVRAAQAVKTVAAFAEMDGLAQGASFEEVQFFEVEGRERIGERIQIGREGSGCGIVRGDFAGTRGGDFVGQAHFEDVASFAALDEAERAEDGEAADGEAADGFAHGAGADAAESASDPGHGAVELKPAFEARVAEEIEIDGAVHDGEAQARVENVSELDAEMLEVEFVWFHGWAPKRVQELTTNRERRDKDKK